MEKGNKSINKSMVKTIFEGNILIPLPKVLVGNRFHSLFSIISPTHCDFCGTELNVNSHYTRFSLTSLGVTQLVLCILFSLNPLNIRINLMCIVDYLNMLSLPLS